MAQAPAFILDPVGATAAAMGFDVPFSPGAMVFDTLSPSPPKPAPAAPPPPAPAVPTMPLPAMPTPPPPPAPQIIGPKVPAARTVPLEDKAGAGPGSDATKGLLARGGRRGSLLQ